MESNQTLLVSVFYKPPSPKIIGCITMYEKKEKQKKWDIILVIFGSFLVLSSNHNLNMMKARKGQNYHTDLSTLRPENVSEKSNVTQWNMHSV